MAVPLNVAPVKAVLIPLGMVGGLPQETAIQMHVHEYIYIYRITRMFCKHQTFANFAMVDQFVTIQSARPSKYTRFLPERNS